MAELRTERKKQKKKGKWKKRILYISLLILIAIISIVAYFFFQVYGAAQDSHVDLDRPDGKSEKRTEQVEITNDPISILLMGVENYSSDGINGRADTLIVATLNPDTKEVTMTSVPRDTRVELPAERAGTNAGMHKINASYTFGSISGYGAEKATVETVEEFLDIPIDEYIAVDFEGFRDIVDALGGVQVDIKEGFWEENIFNDNKRIYFEQGSAELNGEEALAFVRMRKRDVNTIYPRDERQRQFIKASLDQAISAGTIFRIDEITDILGEHVTTSLSAKEIYHLQQSYSSIRTSSIKTHNIEGTNQRINGLYYFIPTEEGINVTTERLKQELELLEENSSESTPETSTQTSE
ncbi:LytR family transcriptional regulator [Gracilibacillus halophilus YIM-C55.5]|uniref:LytR family transcriptional regulator n=1 Tax=Gracilibacillus halophilus YIM-C55.5 TaxID=1308866 RepID=N4WAX2_9BACI|nr:LCP family protein [Gracilibacillus halophilus]ENH96409.1 LytR family transcriptional regulator [Gracilibacillus halophilus YIM-C55.5]